MIDYTTLPIEAHSEKEQQHQMHSDSSRTGAKTMQKKHILKSIDRQIEVRKRRITQAKVSYETKVKQNKSEIDALLERRAYIEQQPVREREKNMVQSRMIKDKWNDPEFLQAWAEGMIAAGRKIRDPRFLKYAS